MNNSQRNRLWIVTSGMMIFGFILVAQLLRFQIVQAAYYRGWAITEYLVVDKPQRGLIYDRNGAILASNTADYQIGATPNLVTEAEELATALAPILGVQSYQLKASLQSNRSYVSLAGRVSPEMADLIRAIPEEFKDGLQIEPLPRRFFPQGTLLSHILGYVNFEGQGRSGLEGRYNSELAGEAASHKIKISPLEPPQEITAREGADLVLTIDRTVQFTVEEYLKDAVEKYEAEGGLIIVMDPRTGAILGMASEPGFDPYNFYKADESLLLNPFVSKVFEPGSVMKLVTMAAALDSGTVTPNSTYLDNGELWIGGHKTVNWDREAHGTVDMTTLLAQSLNVGAATLATWMGPETFYNYMQSFGFGRPTGIDLMSEANGLMPLPGDEQWIDSFLATNSYGQSIATTPIQMTAAISALANDGSMMQPYLVQEIRRGEKSYYHEPQEISRPVSKEAARALTAMATNALNIAIPLAQVPGYTVAGKTGTAQIPENGVYLPDDVIGTFSGWLPADDPEIVVFVKIDKPNIPWGSQTAAPTFSLLARELVVLLDIPPDSIRLEEQALAARIPGPNE